MQRRKRTKHFFCLFIFNPNQPSSLKIRNFLHTALSITRKCLWNGFVSSRYSEYDRKPKDYWKAVLFSAQAVICNCEDVSPVHLQNMGISIPKSESLWNFQDKQFVPWINTRNWGYFVLSQLVNSVLLGIKNCYLLWFSYLLLQSLPVFVHRLLRCILCSDLVWKIWGSNSGLQMYLGTYMTALSHPRLKLHFSHH